MMAVFDPAEHKIVAIDKAGRHLHVTLLELAMDMSEVDFEPFFERMRHLEDLAKSAPVQSPAADLAPLEGRVAALERRPEAAPPPPVPDVGDLVSAVLARVPKPEPVVIPRAAPAFDPAPLHEDIAALKDRLAAADRRHVDDARAMQAVMQAMDVLMQRIEVIENAMTAVAEAAERTLSAA